MSDKIINRKVNRIKNQSIKQSGNTHNKGGNPIGAKSEGTWWWCDGKGNKFLYEGIDKSGKNKLSLDGKCNSEMRWYSFDGGSQFSKQQFAENYGQEKAYVDFENPGIRMKHYNNRLKRLPAHFKSTSKRAMEQYPGNINNLNRLRKKNRI